MTNARLLADTVLKTPLPLSIQIVVVVLAVVLLRSPCQSCPEFPHGAAGLKSADP